MKSKNNSQKIKKENTLLLNQAIQSIQFELLATYQIGDKVKIQYGSYHGKSELIEGKIVGANITSKTKKITSYWIQVKGQKDPYYVHGMKNNINKYNWNISMPSFYSPEKEKCKKNWHNNTVVSLNVTTLDKLNKLDKKK